MVRSPSTLVAMDSAPPSSAPRSRSVSVSLFVSVDSDVEDGSVGEWRAATKSLRTPKSGSCSGSKTQIRIKAEEGDEVVITGPEEWTSSRAGSAAQTTKKRNRSHDISSAPDGPDKRDDHIKSESPDLPSLEELLSPPKRRKSIFKNTPMFQRQSTPSDAPEDKDSDEEAANEESEYEYDLESTSASEDDHDNGSHVKSPKASSLKKKPRAKSVKSAKEWWARCYDKRAKFRETRSRRIFAKDGATSKMNSFIDYDPIAAHKNNSDKEEAPQIDASSKKDYFDQVLHRIRTDGRVHSCRGDKTALKVAGESFGRANVKFEKNRPIAPWSVKGIETRK